MKESDFKGEIVKKIRAEGGYGRRIEDQFAVGIFDVILIPKGGPVFFVEAKVIRSSNWGASTRQMIELQRVEDAGGLFVVCCEMGYSPKDDRVTLRIINTDIERSRPRKGLTVTELLKDIHFVAEASERWMQRTKQS